MQVLLSENKTEPQKKKKKKIGCYWTGEVKVSVFFMLLNYKDCDE